MLKKDRPNSEEEPFTLSSKHFHPIKIVKVHSVRGVLTFSLFEKENSHIFCLKACGLLKTLSFYSSPVFLLSRHMYDGLLEMQIVERWHTYIGQNY